MKQFLCAFVVFVVDVLFIYVFVLFPAHFRMLFYICGYLLQSTLQMSGKTKEKL